ncbi:IS3 family transposase [Lujinxingia litoralis]|uniref:IS3 family transposase n=1 Tax=Lujinxingia litoralis TaxID=2211119 RepID=A0A328C3V5_9DELT|nr:IS3 family transposase [Lujinxingia litoralis]RAL19972.1 IS3 family transposase [Lujinxingia litoralis]
MERHPAVSERRLCGLLALNRSTVWRQKKGVSRRVVNLEKEREKRELVERMQELVKEYPTWGYRRIWAWLRFRDLRCINKKRVERLMCENGWQARCIVNTPRPRVVQSVSQASQPDERWAMDATSLYCEQDGWIGVMAVIDCCTREIVGIDVARRGRAVEAQRALESACLKRFGLIYPNGESRPVLRSDNGKVFTSKSFTGSCKQYGLTQEFITPYTPQQNGLIERFFRSLKEECIWMTNFKTFAQAREAIESWVEFYNTERPHQALGYKSPAEYGAQFGELVA